MKVNGISGANNGMQAGSSGRITKLDSVSKNIQNQIANAQKKLQELSSNEELSIEDKMKKRQEIQQEINNLNQQLRQHQMEQRKEQQTKKTSMDDFTIIKLLGSGSYAQVILVKHNVNGKLYALKKNK